MQVFEINDCQSPDGLALLKHCAVLKNVEVVASQDKAICALGLDH